MLAWLLLLDEREIEFTHHLPTCHSTSRLPAGSQTSTPTKRSDQRRGLSQATPILAGDGGKKGSFAAETQRQAGSCLSLPTAAGRSAGGAGRVVSSVFASPHLVWCRFKDLDEPGEAEQVQFASVAFPGRISCSLTNVHQDFRKTQKLPQQYEILTIILIC